jgi:hypothetical protein
VTTVAPGKHRRPAPETQAAAGMPFSSAGFLQEPLDLADLAAADSGTWVPPYPDHPSAPVPRVPAPLVPPRLAQRAASGPFNPDAAAREAAEREAAHLRAVILELSEQLSQMSAYVTQNLQGHGALATIPAPGDPPASPPGPRPARARKPLKRPRQYQAMRVTTYATTALLLFAVITGAAEMGLHGFKFFVFRPGGTGETSGSETDQQFLARQAVTAHHVVAPEGRHAIKPPKVHSQ